MAGSIYSVAQVNSYIKNLFVQDFLLNRISVRERYQTASTTLPDTYIFTLKRQIRDLIRGDVCRSKERSLTFQLQEGAAGGGDWFHRYLREGR